MKVLCEQCKKEISKEVDYSFEKIILGKVKCPHCGNIQGRFISQTDMYLFLGITEAIYVILTVLGIYVYDKMSQYWWLIIVFFILLALIVVVEKNVARFVYKKEMVKLSISEQTDKENINKIRTEISRSFMIYSIFAILSILTPDYRIEFIIGLIIITIVTFVKFYMNINENKKATK